MQNIADPRVAEAIIRVREEKAKVIPGYDGVYGQLSLFEEPAHKAKKTETVKQQTIADFL